MASRDLAQEPFLLLAQFMDFGYLYECEFADKVKREIHRRLKKHDNDLFSAITKALSDDLCYSPSEKALFLEALATARVPEYEDRVEFEIYMALNSGDEALSFSAIAASSELSKEHRSRIAQFVRENIKVIKTSESVKRAIKAFLEANP
jgi:mRNA-degrading endonuclease RelE of RelBE toxin-antitoxin system